MVSLLSDQWAGLMIWWKPFHRPDIEILKELIAAGKLTPVIDRRYSLSEVVEALRYVDEGRAKGKVVIKHMRHGRMAAARVLGGARIWVAERCTQGSNGREKLWIG